MSDSTKLTVGPDSPDNETFGELLERFRIEAELSRAEIANTLDFSSEYIRLIERGVRTPALGIMAHILSEYGIKTYRRGSRDLEIITKDNEIIKVKFTSRILEARGQGPLGNHPSTNRQKLLGQIVELLPETDNKTLISIWETLTQNEI